MEKNLIKSGEFLLKDVCAEQVFTPEEFTEEQKMIAQTCQDFIENEVYPNLDKLDKQDRELMRSLIVKSGELGLTGIAIPEEYNGFGQNFVTQMLVAEVVGSAYSFSVAFMAHTGIGTMPIMYYGNEEQRQKYVTKLATAEYIGAYCLTEPGAGSDANAGKTNAKLSECGKYYILNGQKMWITNAGFADTLVVFAKIENDRILSAFIVESKWDGVVIGPDEHKMGIKGSSTAQIYFNDVKVPVENLIGQRGEGFRIALSILHMGRLKLGANVLGAAKKTITDSVKYANERKQFGTLISNFGAIKYKIAEMIVKTYGLESAVYRVSKDIDDLIDIYKSQGMEKGRASIEAISHYAVEAALLKVYGSETLDYIVDEAVQIHGGMGYSAEVIVERAYRDSRINRIFEGTNEINRLLVFETTMKRGMKGDYNFAQEAERLYQNIDELINTKIDNQNSYFDVQLQIIGNFKKSLLLLSHIAMKKFQKSIMNEQEVVNCLSDIISAIYVVESTALRLKKIANNKHNIELYKDILNVLVFETSLLIKKEAAEVLSAVELDEPETNKLNRAIESLTYTVPLNIKEARRRIANYAIENNRYCF